MEIYYAVFNPLRGWGGGYFAAPILLGVNNIEPIRVSCHNSLETMVFKTPMELNISDPQ